MARYAAWGEDLERALAEPFPAALVQQKRKGGSNISFVPWHVYASRLNDLVGPGWSIGELTMREVGGKLVTSLPLTILGTTRVNVGSEDEEKDDFGDACTNSWAQAFKRSCALFGLGLSMYDKAGVVAKLREQERATRPQVQRLGGRGPYKDAALVDVPDADLMSARDALLNLGDRVTPAHEAKLRAIIDVLADRDRAAANALPEGES